MVTKWNDFKARTPEELLGLITIHEVHGDDWRRWVDGEWKAAETDSRHRQAFDTGGNLLPDE